jgi:drug/metabolite transporter (DMT)-like permease
MHWLQTHAIALGAALLAAVCTAVGIVVRQRAIQNENSNEQRRDVVVTSFVHQPLWWAGTLAACGGYVFQAIALVHGSLLLVQPLLVSSLLFVLPLGAVLSRQRVSAGDLWWAVVLTVALAVFIGVGQPAEGQHPSAVPAWTVVSAATVPAVAGCVVAARRTAGRVRALLLAVAVAVMLGMVAVLTKVSTHRYAVGGWHSLLTVPAPYLLVALAITVTVLQQSAFRAGALQASVPIMLVGEPVVAVLIGVVVLGDHLDIHGTAVPTLLSAISAMTVATIVLAHGRGSSTKRGVHPGEKSKIKTTNSVRT